MEFSDIGVATDAHALNAAMVMGALLGSQSISQRPDLVGLGMRLLDGGMTRAELSNFALHAVLGESPSNAEVINCLYSNVVGVAPDPQSTQYFLDLLASGAFTQESLAAFAVGSQQNVIHIGLFHLIDSGVGFL